jgi:hypothetical protein
MAHIVMKEVFCMPLEWKVPDITELKPSKEELEERNRMGDSSAFALVLDTYRKGMAGASKETLELLKPEPEPTELAQDKYLRLSTEVDKLIKAGATTFTNDAGYTLIIGKAAGGIEAIVSRQISGKVTEHFTVCIDPTQKVTINGAILEPDAPRFLRMAGLVAQAIYSTRGRGNRSASVAFVPQGQGDQLDDEGKLLVLDLSQRATEGSLSADELKAVESHRNPGSFILRKNSGPLEEESIFVYERRKATVEGEPDSVVAVGQYFSSLKYFDTSDGAKERAGWALNEKVEKMRASGSKELAAYFQRRAGKTLEQKMKQAEEGVDPLDEFRE